MPSSIFMHPHSCLLLPPFSRDTCRSSFILHNWRHRQNGFHEPMKSSWAQSRASCPSPSCTPLPKPNFLSSRIRSHDASSMDGSTLPRSDDLVMEWLWLSVCKLGVKIASAVSSAYLKAATYHICTSPGPEISHWEKTLNSMFDAVPFR